MPVYEYECGNCGLRFERRQSMDDSRIAECPECKGGVRLLVSGGVGVVTGSSAHERKRGAEAGCSFEQTGTTCCGQSQRCGEPQCG
jgi:putative FmdB family regulatory protein